VSGALRSRISISAWIALAVASCSGEVAIESTPSGGLEALQADPLLPLLERAVGAPWTTRYQGTRRVELRFLDGEHWSVLSYREKVSANGAGDFAVETTQLMSFVVDPALFLVTQDLREGFLYRYRDFAVRNLGAFFQSHVAFDLGSESQVAGRTCQNVQIESAARRGHVYQVAFDVETGLVLRSIETDADGIEVQRMEFETYSAAPDLSGIAWFHPALPETALDPRGDLSAQAGFEVLQPTLLPDGFRIWKAATLVEETGQTWVKQTFTDGVDPLFFFHRDAPAPIAAGTGGGLVPTADPTDDMLYVRPIGPVTVIEGHLRGCSLIALGKVAGDSLLDMLESAID
jgi:hypothetical protein